MPRRELLQFIIVAVVVCAIKTEAKATLKFQGRFNLEHEKLPNIIPVI
jgi:hypothetical protein